jgi:hypothetical protein
MDDVRFMLLAIFSREAALERVSGCKGVVQLLLQYTSYDPKWIHWQGTLKIMSYESLVNSKGTLDHFLRRLRYFPRITLVEKQTALILIHHLKKVLKVNWPLVSTNFHFETLDRMFDILKKNEFKDRLIQEIFRTKAKMGDVTGRFGRRELENMNYFALLEEGIEIVRIHEDFKGCESVLTTSRKHWIRVDVRITNDYPFQSPTVTFLGSLRPTTFGKESSISVGAKYEWAFTAVEDVLRVLLLEIEEDGIVINGEPAVFL